MTMYEDELDLRPYIRTLIRHWWQIALLAIFTGAAAFIFSKSQPDEYEATSAILLSRTRAALALAQQFPTISEPIDARSRMDAMLAIAQSDALALETLQNFTNNNHLNKLNIAAFKNWIKVTNSGDLILITASDNDPALAAEIANTWASNTVTRINQAYTGDPSLEEIQEQLRIAQSDYFTAQENLEAFIQDNQIAILKEQIDNAHTVFVNLSGEHAQLVSYYANRKHEMEIIQVEAEALKRQLQNGGFSSAGDFGDALAVLNTRATLLAIQSPPPFQSQIAGRSERTQSASASSGQVVDVASRLILNLNLGDLESLVDSPANYIADLDTIIEIASQEKGLAETNLDTLAQYIFHPENHETIETLDARIRDLETLLEREQARRLELSSQRDLNWQAYQAIAEKEIEIKKASQTNNQVNLASLAIPPQNPTSQNATRNSVMAGLMGMIFGVLFVFTAHWWQSSNKEVTSISNEPDGRDSDKKM